MIYADPLFVRTGRGSADAARGRAEADPVRRARPLSQSLAIAADGGDRIGRTISIGLSDDFEIALGRALIDAVARKPPASG